MNLKLGTRTRSRRRVAGEQLGQSLAIASQMCLLYPPGLDEWMRRELSGGVGSAPSADAPRYRSTLER